MKSISLLSIATVAANALLQPSPAVSDPTITPAPQISVELLRKQNNNRFMGWVSYSTGWSSRQCDIGGTLYQSGDYWRCCATSVASCNVPVGCISGSLIYSFATGTASRRTYACTDIYSDPADRSFTICNTGFMFENTLDSGPQTNVFCGISSVNWSYYRVKPEETSAVASSVTSSSPKSTPATPTATGQTSPSASPINQPQIEQKSKSKAWIAGVVIGPIAGIAIIGLIAWIFLIKKKKKNAAAAGAPPGVGGAEAAPPYNPASPQQGYQQPMQQNGAGGFVPFGVSEQKHQSWMQPPPGSPLSSPQTQHATPYFEPATPNGGYYPPPTASPPPQTNTEYYKQPHVGTTQFTSELEASTPPPAPAPTSAISPLGSPTLAPVEAPANPAKK
ncbi:hypothetical protein B0J11DRAFT_59100 [Dendryphion nanum]|uniref:Uncharacterized protein n=1 Tax=Dendryphion nanum TaxID=256645 RepID=A0A9P9IJ46_9PLEO|nr:hypothetical protein B0J11DRAFT_59100 [Dendryphion nanum]